MKNGLNKKAIVAMSGGVDSSVVAAMLKKEGFDVVGIFMNFWKDASLGKNYENRCCSLEAIESARKIAQIIGIPFYVLNVQNDFKKKVVDYFLDELKKGNTPNPCVVCNKEIKFKVLFERMLALKADYVATGHYARIKRIMNHESRSMDFRLLEAVDKNKDQSYFLYNFSQKQLSKILFPLGDYTKIETRKMAKKFGLPVYDKKESQDVCFIPEKGYESFLRKHISFKKGKIFDSEGNILGTHEGLPFYTIGQRKGIKIGGNGPYYVVKKDNNKNRLIVGEKKKLFSKKMILKEINWIREKPKFPFETLIRARYQSPLFHAIINKDRVDFEKPQQAITSGQSAVFYSKDGEVIGGGVIK
ncbi:MAG: tRNA 2-thiouridine(34) synthase MnmA [bacterium]|nr:tRNA 2-thiouridine(34) synthase MnmA [bacterium]